MAKPVTFNVQRLIAAVATEHRLLFKPDDAAFAIVTMNRLVLEESLEAIRAVIAEDLAQFKQTAQWQMKLQMKREALTKINRQANESGPGFGTVQPN